MQAPGLTDAAYYSKLLRYCALQERSLHQAKLKLQQLGCKEPRLGQLLAKLVGAGMVDDARYTGMYVRSRWGKRWGRVKIRHALQAQHIARELIEEALNQEITDEAYEQAIDELLQRKKSTLPKALDAPETGRRLANFLLQRGFEWPVVLASLRRARQQPPASVPDPQEWDVADELGDE